MPEGAGKAVRNINVCCSITHDLQRNASLQTAHLKLGLNQLCTVLLQQLKQLTILDASHLQDLSRPIAQVPVTQSLQEGLVNENCQGSTIGAHLVLSAMKVDSCLDSNRCINSCHDCGGNLDEWGVTSVQIGS